MANNTSASINKLFGTIATAQTVVEQAPFSFKTDEKGFTCSIDLLTALLDMVLPMPLEQYIIKLITDKMSDNSGEWLMYIEDTCKLALLANFTSMLTCEMSPIIPDKLIGGAEFLEGTDRQINFSGEGITIPVSAIDITGLLQHCPTDENDVVGQSNYIPCYKPGSNEKLTVADIWKHTDFNAFLWYVKNKGAYGNMIERRKLLWDNRYKSRVYEKPQNREETFFTKSFDLDKSIPKEGIIPFDKEYLEKYNQHKKGKDRKKQILECRYIQGDGVLPDSFQFRLAGSTYYKTRNLKGAKTRNGSVMGEKYAAFTNIFALNKTIFEFNADFINSLKLFDMKTYLCQVFTNLLGTGNFSVGLTGEKVLKSDASSNQELELLIESITNKILSENDLVDSQTTDCYFTFSNAEYNEMLKNSLKKKRILEDNEESANEIYDNIIKHDYNNSDSLQTKEYLNNTLGRLSEIAISPKTYTEWDVQHTNVVFDLIRMIVYPFIRPLFSPKVLTLLMINLKVMGDPLKLAQKTPTLQDITPYLMNVIKDIIINIKDIIVEMLYSALIEYLSPLLSMFTLRILYEQIEMYRRLVMDMIEACTGWNNRAFQSFGIADVRYADIDPLDEQQLQKPLSQTNC